MQSPVVEFVSVVVGGHNVQQQNVLGFWVETGDSELHLREHLPVVEKAKEDFVC